MTEQQLSKFMDRIEKRDENLADILEEVYDLGKEAGEQAEFQFQMATRWLG